MSEEGFDPSRYRRREDQGMLVLSERLNNLQRNFNAKSSSQEGDIKDVEKKQNANPCDTNSMRITHLEKVAWLTAGAVLGLAAKTIYFLVDK